MAPWRPLYLQRRLRDAANEDKYVGGLKKDQEIVPKRSNVRRLLDLMLVEWPTLSAGIVGLSISSLTNLLFPKVLGAALDVACGRPPPRNMTHKAFFMTIFSIFVSGATASFIRVYCLGSVAESIAKRLRDRLYASYMAQDMHFFTNAQRTELVHRLTHECQTAADAVVNIIADGYRSLNSSIGASYMLFRLSPTLTVVSLTTLPFLGAGAMTFRLYLKSLERKYDVILASLRASTDEKIGAIETVKLSTQENNEIKLFSEQTTKVARAARLAKAAEGLYMGGLSLSINISLASVLWVGGSIVGSGALTTGELTSFMMYSGFMCLGFAQLSTLASKIRSTNDATKVLFTLLDEKSQVEASATMTNVQGNIEFKDVEFVYPGQNVLYSSLSWNVSAGSIVALVGASGAGKSTLATLLTRLETPIAGSITLDGINIATLDKSFLRHHVGMVLQEAAIFNQTVFENIQYSDPAASNERVYAAAELANVHTFAKDLINGYDTQVTPGTLSGGQKQRIALARALLNQPQVLILDEATAALDGQTEQGILENLKKLGITVIVIAHRLSTIRACERIAVLHEGTIAESGTFDELSRDGTIFRSLVASHAIETGDN